MPNLISNPCENPSPIPKMIRQNIEKNVPKYPKLLDAGSHCGASRFVLRPDFSEPLGGTPWIDFGISQDSLAPMFLIAWMNLRADLIPMSTKTIRHFDTS